MHSLLGVDRAKLEAEVKAREAELARVRAEQVRSSLPLIRASTCVCRVLALLCLSCGLIAPTGAAATARVGERAPKEDQSHSC